MAGTPKRREKRQAEIRAALEAGVPPGLAAHKATRELAMHPAPPVVDAVVEPPTDKPAEMTEQTKNVYLNASRHALIKAVPAAAQTIIDILGDPAAAQRDRLNAAKELLDRVYGKAAQPVEVGGNVNHTIKFEGDLEKWSR